MFVLPLAARMNFPRVVPTIGDLPLCDEVEVDAATLKLWLDKFIELTARCC